MYNHNKKINLFFIPQSRLHCNVCFSFSSSIKEVRVLLSFYLNSPTKTSKDIPMLFWRLLLRMSPCTTGLPSLLL